VRTWKAHFVTELTDEAIAAHIPHGKRTPHVSSSMHLNPINGAAQRVGASETAFEHRDKNFVLAPARSGSAPQNTQPGLEPQRVSDRRCHVACSYACATARAPSM
jgi:hypothetical protein